MSSKARLILQEFPPADEKEAQARLLWRHQVSNMDIRSLCYDYLIGQQDPCTFDAYLEYHRRFGPPTGADRGRSKTAPKGARKAKSSTYEGGPITADMDYSRAFLSNTIIG